MRTVIYLAILIPILQGCFFSNCDKIALSANDREWLSPYEVNDTLVFRNTTKQSIDTFCVSYCATSYSDCNKIEKSSFQYEEGLIRAVRVNQSGSDSRYNCGFIFRETKELQKDSNQLSSKHFGVFDYFSDEFTDVESELVAVTKRIDYYNGEVTGYFFDSKQKNGEKPCSERVISFVWSKEYGLLSYVLDSGKEYVLSDTW